MQPHDTTELSPRIKNLVGQRFGRLLVISFAGTKHRKALWNCVCDCGNHCEVIGCNLRRGTSTSCGCYRLEFTKENNSTHHMSNTPTWNTYRRMMERCYYPRKDSYPKYGGRGIAVCSRWRESFENFFADMGTRPDDCTLDRIDNDGPYSPENCRWATSIEQMNNRTNNVFVTYEGKTLTATQWSRIVGIPVSTIRSRIRRGWTAEQTLTEEPNPNRKILRHGTALNCRK